MKNTKHNSKRLFILFLMVAMVFSLPAALPAGAAVGDAVPWNITWNGGTSMTISWPAVAGATSYTIERAGARLGTYTNLQTANTTRTYTDNAANANKYENYYRITPNAGAAFYISLEGKIFGPNCYFYNSKYHSGTVAAADINSRNYNTAMMGSQRVAYFFKPGDYNDNRALSAYFNAGFYVSIYGLGRLPTDTAISSVQCPTNALGSNATQTYWRSIENVYCKYGVANDGNNCLRWAVAQGAPVRRLQADAAQFDWDNGWASGGFLADSRILGSHGSYSCQQFYYRSNWLANTPYGMSNWNFLYEGDAGPGRKTETQSYASGGKTTSYSTVQGLMREKPFLYLDGGEYKVFVPGWRNNAAGPSWDEATNNMGAGLSLDLLNQFYIAYPGNTSAEINDALAAGKHLLLTPGTYVLDTPIFVSKPSTVVLGLGYATLTPSQTNEWGAMVVEDVAGVVVSGLLFEARGNSVYLLRVGEEGIIKDNNLTNPIMLHDVFFRIDGTAGQPNRVDAALQINANGTVADHVWIWRNANIACWESNKCDYGLFVSGDNVTVHALFNDGAQKYTTYWEGEKGKTFFLAGYTPYDPISQADYRSHNGTVNGWAQYKVANKVFQHFAAGLGAYASFTKLTSSETVMIQNAFEVPIKPGVDLHHIMNINISSRSSDRFLNMVNNTGPGATGTTAVYMNDYPPASGDQGTYPSDELIAPPSYDDYGIGYPPERGEVAGFARIYLALTDLTWNGPIYVNNDDPLNVSFSTALGYYVPAGVAITYADSGAPFTDFTYTPSVDRRTATLYFAAVPASLTVSAAGLYDASAITYNLTNLTTDGPALVYNGLPLNITLTAAAGCSVPESISVSGAAFTYAPSLNKKSATVSIAAVNGDITITAAGIAGYATVTYNLSGLTQMAGAPSIADLGLAVGLPLQVANGGYTMPASVSVTMGGAALTAGVHYTYTRTANNMSGIILVHNVSGAIVVSATATGAGGLPGPGDANAFYLIALKNGKIVSMPAGYVVGTANNNTMVANKSEYEASCRLTYSLNVNAGLPTRPAGVIDCFFRAANGFLLSLDSTDWNGEKVAPRGGNAQGGGGIWDGWEALIIIPQPGGTIKIGRDSVRNGVKWIVVEDDGDLMSRPNDGGEASKFTWFYTNQSVIIPVNKADLLSALRAFYGLSESDWATNTWANAAAQAVLSQAVYDSAAASQAAVDASAANMWAAIEALVEMRPVCEIVGGSRYANIAEALGYASGHNGSTIKLLADITYDATYTEGLFIYNNLTIDTNGYTLNVVTNFECAIWVIGNTAALNLAGPPNGKLNASGIGGGIAVANGATATVSSAAATEMDAAAYATPNSALTITGNATSPYMGLYAQGGTIWAGGDVYGGDVGAYAANGGTVTIDGTLSVAEGARYVLLGTTVKGKEEFSTPTTKRGYLTYSDGTNTVWVKAPPGVTVSGQIKSYHPQHSTDLELWREGGKVAAYNTTIYATKSGFGQWTQEFSFEDVEPGTYTLVVTKAAHTSYTVHNIVVAGKDVDLTEDKRPEVQLMTMRCGDINGDGNINNSDLTIMWQQVNYNRSATAAKEPLCDLNGDGLINNIDLTILWLAYNYNRGAVEIK